MTHPKSAEYQKRFVFIKKTVVTVFAYNDYLCKKFENLLQKCPFGLTPPNISFDNPVRLFKTEQFRFAAFLWPKSATLTASFLRIRAIPEPFYDIPDLLNCKTHELSAANLTNASWVTHCLQRCFVKRLLTDLDFFDTLFLLLIEVETEHITCLQIEVV